VIRDFAGAGIRLATSGGNFIEGNFIGTDVSGALDRGNASAGVRVESSGNTIGGTTAAARNVISGNDDHGVWLVFAGATGNLVLGNLVGTDVSGSLLVANAGWGVMLESGPSSNTIGGTTAFERNVVSGNKGGVVLWAAEGNVVSGNFIGTDLSGDDDRGNLYHGLWVGCDADPCTASSVDNTFGGTAPGAGNVVSGNNGQGILISEGSQGTQVLGNHVGTDGAGTTGLGNSHTGIVLQHETYALTGTSGNTIGGVSSGAGNVVSDNVVGVALWGVMDNDVLGNSIGTDVTGTLDLGNSLSGLWVGCDADVCTTFSDSNDVGGIAPGAGNLISGNGEQGILINESSTGIRVLGNRIGTDITGTWSLGNTEEGVSIEEAGVNSIGGLGVGNVISGNEGAGVLISGLKATGNQVLGNRIGTDAGGTAWVPNADGVVIDNAPSNTIGGADSISRNVVTGLSRGVYLTGALTTSNEVLGNLIGTDVSGTADLGSYAGVRISEGASKNTIGGPIEGAGNVISGNTVGVQVWSGPNNKLLGNLIGTDITGTEPLGNSASGVEVSC
jgi:titin